MHANSIQLICYSGTDLLLICYWSAVAELILCDVQRYGIICFTIAEKVLISHGLDKMHLIYLAGNTEVGYNIGGCS